jgi:hypothetical protein
MRVTAISLLLLALARSSFPQGFVDVLQSSGIAFRNVSGDVRKNFILSSLGGGVAVFDYDGDGDLDVYFVNGNELVEGRAVPRGPNRLYRNEGEWRFRDVTQQAGVGDEGWGIGCAVGDLDNDGLLDLYVTNLGPNVLYRNLGDGTFENVTSSRGGGDDRFGASAAFFDAEGDGDLDLYVANYVDPDLSKIPEPGAEPTCLWLGLAVMCGPRGLDGQADVFYRNDEGNLVESSESAGLVDVDRAFGLGVVSADYDDDGDADLYVANDTDPNFLYQNDGEGRFTEVGLLAGVSHNVSGATEAGMGVDFGDVNGDGRLDLFVTNFSHETNTLFLAGEGGFFSDVTDEQGLGAPSLGKLGWGTRFEDLDNDGDLDLFVANGHVYPNVSEADATTSYFQRNQIYLNRGDGRFEEGALPVGDETHPRASRGAAFGDVDGDGDIDVIVVNIDDVPSLLRNELTADLHWIGLQLVGRQSNRDAYGARVTIEAGGARQIAERHASGSIFSSSDPRLHFGLGTVSEVRAIRIRWPSGSMTTLDGLGADRYWLVIEGSDVVYEMWAEGSTSP